MTLPQKTIDGLKSFPEWSERDAYLNDPGLCAYCGLVIFAGEKCVFITPKGSKWSGHLRGFGLHEGRCRDEFYREAHDAGIVWYTLEDEGEWKK